MKRSSAQLLCDTLNHRGMSRFDEIQYVLDGNRNSSASLNDVVWRRKNHVCDVSKNMTFTNALDYVCPAKRTLFFGPSNRCASPLVRTIRHFANH